MKTSNFQFKFPFLTKVSFNLNDEFEDFQGNIDLKSKFDVKVHMSEKEKIAHVILQIKLGGEETDQPFELEIVMQSEFLWKRELEQEQLNALLSQNAPSVLLSYARPIIANITSSSPFPTYNIPFMNFTKDQINFE